MDLAFAFAVPHSLSTTIVWILLDSSLKSTILFVVAIATTWAFRRGSAAIRDRIWGLAFCGAIAIPFVSACLPHWRIVVEDRQTLPVRMTRPEIQGELIDEFDLVTRTQNSKARSDWWRKELTEEELARETFAPEVAATNSFVPAKVDNLRSSKSTTRSIQFDPFDALMRVTASQLTRIAKYSQFIASGWFVGFVLIAVPFFSAVLATWILLLTGRRLNDPLACQLFEAITIRLGLERRVTLLQAGHNTVPITFGVFRPAVVLPANWQAWPTDRFRIVILHELSHIQRFDVLFQSLARLVCAVYWFNPLAWYAFHRMRMDCELACDDRVIQSGERVSEYADQLIEIARLYRRTRFALGIAMARTSKLEGRIVALLDGNRTRLPLGKRAGSTLLALASILVLSLGVISVDQSQAIALESSTDVKADFKPISPNPQNQASAKLFAQNLSLPKTVTKAQVGERDWPQWGGSSHRNNTPTGEHIPVAWDLATGANVLWAAQLGTQSYNTPVISNGKVFMGTNNAHGYLKQYPPSVDLGVLLAFDERTGEFLWQASSPKLESGRVHDWPTLGICSTPCCEDKRLWYVTNRGEVVCLDVEGFRDGVNNGPFKSEPNENKDEADIIWRFDMLRELGVSQHNATTSSITCYGDRCFLITGNGVDESHVNIPSPSAPSFIALDKNTGKLLWTDNSPGFNILHGQWSSPCAFEAGGREQVVMPGGDGWLYGFDPAGDGSGGSKLLWKFDGNPKETRFVLVGRSARNHFISTPVFYDGHVYIGVGEDPEHGEGVGHLYCIDPTKSGDVSHELAVDRNRKQIPPRRIQAVDANKGEKAIPNPNSALVWHYDWVDQNGNGKQEFEEVMHRTISTVAIKNDLMIVPDFAGLVHCLDANKTENGKPVVYWTYDMFSSGWTSALIVENRIYVCDEDGDVTVLELSTKRKILAENNLGNSIFATPVVANNTLYLSNRRMLYAIKSGTKLEGGVRLLAE